MAEVPSPERRAPDGAETTSFSVTVGTPVYLDLEVPHMIDVVPPVASWSAALAGDRTRPVY